MSNNPIAARIKMAREMAGFKTQALLLAQISDWKPSRLGNYEAGISTPSADDVCKIAKATETSPCWLMFGDGPIRPNARDLQAIRHQNLSHMVQELDPKRGALARFAKQCALTKAALLEQVDNPFLPIEDTLARKLEKAWKVNNGWMDEQHIENDPLCQSFPDDLRELMMLYSGLSADKRGVVLKTLKALSNALQADSMG